VGLLCLLALGAAALWGLDRHTHIIRSLREVAVEDLSAMAALQEAVAEFEIAILRFMEYIDPDLSRAEKALDAAEAALERLPEPRRARLAPALAQLRDGASVLVDMAEDPEVFEELDRQFQALAARADAVKQEVGRGLEKLRRASAARAETAVGESASLRLFIGATAAAGWLVLLAAAVVSIRSIQAPFRQVLAFLQGASQRDLTVPLEVGERNELGELARAAATLRQNLVAGLSRLRQAAASLAAQSHALEEEAQAGRARAEETLGRVREGGAAAGRVAGETRALRQAAESLRKRAEETASGVQQILAMTEEVRAEMEGLCQRAEESDRAVEELGRAASQVAAFAEQVGAAAQTVGASAASIENVAATLRQGAVEGRSLTAAVLDRADEGLVAMEEARAAMDRIGQAVAAAVDRFDRLDAGLARVGRVLQVIDEVAGRTNLLSLNAAIIAAQAGEKGRSFGVVAGEIRALAEQVSVGTREIRGIVDGLVASGRDTAEAIARGSERVAEGQQRVLATARVLDAIHEAARLAAEHLAAIEEAGTAQAREAEQVAREILQVIQGVEGIVEAVRTQEREVHAVHEHIEAMVRVARQTVRAADEQTQGTELITRGAMEVTRVGEELEAGAGRLDESAEALAENLAALSERAAEDLERAGNLEAAGETLAATANQLSRQVGAYQLPDEPTEIAPPKGSA